MKFVRFIGEEIPVLSIEIIEPQECTEFTYYYPSGITKGIFTKKTYIAKFRNIFGNTVYYETLDEILENRPDLFIHEGKAYVLGKVLVTVKDYPESLVFKYKEPSELKTYLENLSFNKYSIPLQHFVSFEDKDLISLYEYKDKIS